MIPQALTNIGPYAGLWSELKSMRYALARALNADATNQLLELDQARLQALVEFLRNELDQLEGDPGLLSLDSKEPRYSLDIDLRQLVKEIPLFKQYYSSSKMSFKARNQKLLSALEDYLNKLSDSLFTNPPENEFNILYAILTELLKRTEPTLIT